VPQAENPTGFLQVVLFLLAWELGGHLAHLLIRERSGDKRPYARAEIIHTYVVFF
jgi:hypothetical protein